MTAPVTRVLALAAAAALTVSIGGCLSPDVAAFSPHHPRGGQEEASRASLRLEPVWQFVVNEQGIAGFKPAEPYGLAAAHNGIVAIAATSGILHGVEASSGVEQWRIDLGEMPGTPPTAHGEHFYLGVSDGRLLSIHARTGELRWTATMNHIVHGQPTVHNGVVYIQTSEEAVVAVREDNGETLWTYRNPRIAELEIHGGGRPVIIDGDVYVGFSSGALYRLDAQGKMVWFTDLSNNEYRMVDVDGAPIKYENLIIAASYAGGLSAVNQATGTVQWTIDKTGFHTPIVVDDMLIATAGQTIYWIDPISGRIRQELEMLRPGLTAPLRFSDGTFAIGDADRGVTLVDVDGTKLHALFETTYGISGQMARHGDMLFFVTSRGTAYGVRASAK